MKQITTSVTFLFFALSLSAQNDSSNKIGGLFKKANSIFSKNTSSGSSLSTSEIVLGLKEALSLGAEKSATKLSATDGFFKDAAVKILLPEQVRTVESKMRNTNRRLKSFIEKIYPSKKISFVNNHLQ